MENTLFFHGQTLNGRRFTIAGRYIQKGKILKKNLLILGAALCSTNDAFVKKVGRAKAEGRLNQQGDLMTKGKIVMAVPNLKGKEITAFIEYANKFTTLKTTNLQREFNLLKR